MPNQRARDASLLMLIFALFAVALLHDIWKPRPAAHPPVQALLVMAFGGPGHGTGFYIGNGEVITAAHVTSAVADNRGRMWVIVGQKKLLGRLLYADTDMDVAVIKVDLNPALVVNTMVCADHSELALGTEIEAIGYPLEIGLTHTWGRVAAPVLRRGGADDLSISFIADLTVAPGNSGGPVVDMHGNIVGLAEALAVAPLGFANASLVPLSYIIPRSVLCRTVDDEHYLETSEP